MTSSTAVAPLLEIRDLSIRFRTRSGSTDFLNRVAFSVDEGEALGVVGESGSGKTLTGMTILRLHPNPPVEVSGGEILFEGQDLLKVSSRRLQRIRANEIGIIFQDPMTSLSPSFTVGDQIAETVRMHTGKSRAESRKRAIELLEMVGIPNAKSRVKDYPHEFSGGMRQRAMIAIAISCDPKLLIADEPTTALDVTIQDQVLQLINRLRRELGMSLIMITHDLGVVAQMCDRVVVMYAGEVVESAAIEQVYNHPQHPYTAALLRSMPQTNSENEELAFIPGTTPVPRELPSGCRFNTRCEFAIDKCRTDLIEMEELDDRAVRCVRHRELQLEGVE